MLRCSASASSRWAAKSRVWSQRDAGPAADLDRGLDLRWRVRPALGAVDQREHAERLAARGQRHARSRRRLQRHSASRAAWSRKATCDPLRRQLRDDQRLPGAVTIRAARLVGHGRSTMSRT